MRTLKHISKNMVLTYSAVKECIIQIISEKKLREIVNDNNFADIYKDYRITAPVLQSRCEVITFSTKNQNTIPKNEKDCTRDSGIAGRNLRVSGRLQQDPQA